MGLNKKQKAEGAQDPFDRVFSLALEFLENGLQDEPGNDEEQAQQAEEEKES